MTELSPAAQAVLDAYWNYPWDPARQHEDRGSIAAALRAAADQVVPWRPEPTEDSVGPTIDYGYAWALFSKANDIRQELIAIADELDPHDRKISDFQPEREHTASNGDYIKSYPLVTRVEVIGGQGREYVQYDCSNVQVSQQDNGRTLKVFL